MSRQPGRIGMLKQRGTYLQITKLSSQTRKDWAKTQLQLSFFRLKTRVTRNVRSGQEQSASLPLGHFGVRLAPVW